MCDYLIFLLHSVKKGKRLRYIVKIGSPSNMDDQLLHVFHVDGGHLNKAAAASSSCGTTAFVPSSHR